MFENHHPLLHEILELHGKWRGSRPAVISQAATLSWRDFALRVRRVANGLIDAGLRSGDRVGLLMGNETAMIEAMFGIASAGLVAVPLNLTISDAAALAMFKDAGVVALFASRSQVERADQIRTELPQLASGRLFVSGAENAPPPQWIAYEGWIANSSAAAPPAAIKADMAMNIIYSSGTTGMPKGIVHTQGGRLDWAYDLAIALRYHSGARTLLTLGLYSNISWVMMLCTLLAGGTLILHPRFDPAATLRAIANDRVTHTAMVPLQYIRLLEHPEFATADLGAVQSLMSCGSALPAGTKAQLLEAFGSCVIELYGLTEGLVTTLDPEDAAGRLASVGKPIAGTDIRLIDDEGRDVTGDGFGEIVGRSRFTMTGYWNRPKDTADATWTDEHGRPWLRTGDVGRIDRDGFLYIVDRKKDMILSGGQNIYPSDIEAVLVAHPDVRECAVIGVPDVEWGETPLAVIVLETGKAEDGDRVRAWVNERLGKQQRIQRVVFLDQLPRNANGKVLKRELRTALAR